MLTSMIKWPLRFALWGVIWVFLLAIEVEQKPLFDYARTYLVENPYVAAIDAEVWDLWNRIYETAKISYREVKESQDF